MRAEAGHAQQTTTYTSNMSRASSAAQQRSLSLTEELERLEQSITLTLQEIDQNFSVAHRIVTTSILPIVDQYSTHSKAVWEGSKFWKQFFESSANVSLSGYEEGEQYSHLHSNVEESATEEETNTTATHTTLTEDQSYETPSQQHIHTDSIQDLDLSNLTISPSHSTPRPNKKQKPPQFADYPSPYEALRAEVNNTTNLDATSLSQQNPTTPGRGHAILDEIAHTPDTSPVLPRQPHPASTTRPTSGRKRTDPLLHRVLDKTYRVQATPLTANRYRSVHDTRTTTPAPATTTRNPLLDSTLSSSPEVAPPELHAEVFSSPERRRLSPSKPKPSTHIPQPVATGQRTPGVSVLTPARNKFAPPVTTQTRTVWDDDSDEDSAIDEATGLPFGASPPKTMQFHIPQSRLLKTPAKEASRLIVNDVLAAAGVGREEENTEDLDDFEIDLDATNYDEYDDDDDGYAAGARGAGRSADEGFEEHSPTMVRRAAGLEDETF